MTDYYKDSELGGMNLCMSLREMTIANLAKERDNLLYQCHLKDAKIHQLETLIVELYSKIDRLINETDVGEEI